MTGWRNEHSVEIVRTGSSEILLMVSLKLNPTFSWGQKLDTHICPNSSEVDYNKQI